MEEKEINEAIKKFILDELGGANEVLEVEVNCGIMYITTTDFKVYSVSVNEINA